MSVARSPARRCPYCAFEIVSPGRECPSCSATHHPECWEEGGGCAVVACLSGPARAAPPHRAGVKQHEGHAARESGGVPRLTPRGHAQWWLTVRSGPLAGKQFILHHDQTTIGSSPKCVITVTHDPGVASFHADLIVATRRWRRPGLTLVARKDAIVTVNGTARRRRHLRSGDRVGIGTTELELTVNRRG